MGYYTGYCEKRLPSGRMASASNIGVYRERATLDYPGDYEENWDDATIYVEGVEVTGWRARIIGDWLYNNAEVRDDD